MGRIISAARRVLYYFEPLHPSRTGDDRLAGWFRYARPGDEDEAMARAFDPVFAGQESPARAWNRSAWHRWLPGYRVAVKDVAALMAAEWLAERYDPQVVFVVRHPCAVILSELQQGTPAEQSLATVLAQEKLVADHLAAYASSLERAGSEIEKLAAVWAARHRVVANGLQRHPEWQVVYYEDLCADPLVQFRRLFADLDLRWSNALAAYVTGHSETDEVGMYATRKVSRRQIDKWKALMSTKDIERVRHITRALGIPFYQDQDAWTLTRFLA